MKRLALAVLALLASVLALSVTAIPSQAGPNAGGVLIAHWDAAISYTPDALYIAGSLSGCEEAATQAPPAATFPPPGSERRAWFIYAAFPAGSSPRLKAVNFGITYAPFSNLRGIQVDWAVTPPGSMERPTSTPPWPEANSGNSMVFEPTLTGLVDEILTFAGYGTQGEIFALRPHPTDPSDFVEDGVLGEMDPIAAFGSLGFGVDGHAPCPCFSCDGACCFGDGSCQILSPSSCNQGGGAWRGAGTVCDPNPCPAPSACCLPDCICRILQEPDCADLGGAWLGHGVPCDPNPCACPVGACCLPNGSCSVHSEAICAELGGTWMGDGAACAPNPCPEAGACCSIHGTCHVLTQEACAAQGGSWMAGIPCEPNPCPPLGACCFPDCTCLVSLETDCPTGDWRARVACAPNPCECTTGACCFESGECRVLGRTQCETEGGGYMGDDIPCTPQLCAPVPTQRISWGRIKSAFR